MTAGPQPLLSGGMKVCAVGCLGLGSCVKACQFNALTIGPSGLPVVDAEKCTGCGACERVCPKHIIKLSSVTRRILHEYTLEDCTTPCQRACPAGIDICAYIGQIATGDYLQAVQTIKERNPFPTVIGRICPRPCEDQCRRQMVDEPVAINFLKRFAADYEHQHHERILPFKAPATGRRIAVVGGGIQGLSAAFFAARLGHGPTLYEATDQLGGLLRTAIARNRLPAEILDWDIDGILAMGVEAHTGQALGRDITVSSLLAEGNEAVLLATGGWDSRLARGGAAGRTESPVPGTWLLLDVMRRTPDEEKVPVCQAETVVYGGGALALEAAARCRALGARQVTIVLRETDATPAPSPENGIRVVTGTSIEALHGSGDQLTGLTLVDLSNGQTTHQPAGTLILAAGRAPELLFHAAPADPEAPADAAGTWTAMSPYKAPLISADAKGIFSEADVLSDFSAAIKAIAAGRRAAASVHQLIYDGAVVLADDVVTPHSVIQNVNQVRSVAAVPREIMPLASTAPQPAVEIELGFDETAARREAARCLQCGLICYRRTDEITGNGLPAVPAGGQTPGGMKSPGHAPFLPTTPPAGGVVRFNRGRYRRCIKENP